MENLDKKAESPGNNPSANLSEIPPANGASGENGTAPQTDLFARLKSAAGKAYDNIAFKRGRGRPRKDGTPKANDLPVGLPPDSLTGQPTIDTEIVQKSVAAVVKAACGVAGAQLRKKIVKNTGDKEFANKTVKDCEPSNEEIEALGKLAEICLIKYGVGTEYLPEIGLSCIVLGIGTRYAVAFKAVVEIEQAPPPGPQTEQADQ